MESVSLPPDLPSKRAGISYVGRLAVFLEMQRPHDIWEDHGQKVFPMWDDGGVNGLPDLLYQSLLV